MRGWNYSSNYLNGSDSNEWFIENSQLDYDLADIKAAGFTTVSIYATENNAAQTLAALDKVAAAGLDAIVTRFITYDVDYSVATGGTNRTAAIDKFTGMITNLKGHSAIKMWGFANEANLPNNRGSSTNSENDVTTSIADWYSLVNAACLAGKAIDATRLYFTIEGELGTYPGDSSLTNLDVIAANIYRGTTLTDLKQDVLALTTKPFFLHEFGRSRTSNSQSAQDTQATQNLSLLKEAEAAYPFISSWVHFKFTDSIAPGTVYGATAPLAQGTGTSRTKYATYTVFKEFLNNHKYGET